MQVQIEITKVLGMRTATKDSKDGTTINTTISLDAEMHPGDIARLLNLRLKGTPLFAVVGSRQAQMDLTFTSVKEGEKIPTKKSDIPDLVSSADVTLVDDATLTEDGKCYIHYDSELVNGLFSAISKEACPPIEKLLKGTRVTMHFTDHNITKIEMSPESPEPTEQIPDAKDQSTEKQFEQIANDADKQRAEDDARREAEKAAENSNGKHPKRSRKSKQPALPVEGL